MKKRFLATVFVFLAFVFFAFAGCEKFRTDEEMIVDRIEKFEKSYNDGDYEGFLGNLATKERKQIEAVFNLFGSVMGGLSGFSIDLSDLFSLGIAMKEGDWLKVEIKEIKTTGSTTAIVSTSWSFTQGTLGTSFTQTSDMYFSMVKEDGDWYVKDMTEHCPDGWETL